MLFSKEQLDNLSASIKARLSDERYSHTIGVLQAAKRIGEYFVGIDLSELAAAALLHDVAKEIDEETQVALLEASDIELSESDINSPPIFHALSAPYVIKNEFSDFVTENILSAVKNHTTGCERMSVFDEIIMISDYVEMGRTHESCVGVRNELFEALMNAANEKECITALHKAVYNSLVLTEKHIIKRGRHFNERSSLAKKYFHELLNLQC